MIKLNIVPVIRGCLEIALAVYLINNWATAPKAIIWLMIIATFLEGVNSILESYTGKLNNK